MQASRDKKGCTVRTQLIVQLSLYSTVQLIVQYSLYVYSIFFYFYIKYHEIYVKNIIFIYKLFFGIVVL